MEENSITIESLKYVVQPDTIDTNRCSVLYNEFVEEINSEMQTNAFVVCINSKFSSDLKIYCNSLIKTTNMTIFSR